MIDLDIGGACPRQPLTLALLDGLGMPGEAGLGTGAFCVGSLDRPSLQGVELFAHAAIKERQDVLLAMFADTETSRCGGLVLIYRTHDGAILLDVEPCRPNRGRSMILVTNNRSNAYRLDERGHLTACPVPPKQKIERGIEIAWADLRLSMREVKPDPADWETTYFSAFTDAQAFANFVA